MTLPTKELQQIYSENKSYIIDNDNIKIDLFLSVDAWYSDSIRFINVKIEIGDDCINELINQSLWNTSLIQRKSISLVDDIFSLFRKFNELSEVVNYDQFFQVVNSIFSDIELTDIEKSLLMIDREVYIAKKCEEYVSETESF